MAMTPQQAMTGMPQGGGQAPITTTPDQTNVGTDIKKVLEVLGMGIQQAVDQQGFVDVNRLIMMWPQIAQQAGLNIPFKTVMQLIQQNPQIISDLVVRYGLAGIIKDGQRIGAEQLAGMGSGLSGRGRM